MREIILLTGPPGSGKGSVAPCIAKERRIVHLSTGDMLRDAVAKKTEVGIAAEKVMAEGGLVSDDIVIQIIRDRIQEEDCSHGFLLDGFPRTVEQAKALDDMLRTTREVVDMVIDLQVKPAVLEERICGRWIHKESGRSYHVKFAPPKSFDPDYISKCMVENLVEKPPLERADSRLKEAIAKCMLDDITGEPLYQRADDTPEALKTRLANYGKETAPILKHYSEIVRRVNAEKSIEDTNRDVKSILNRTVEPLSEFSASGAAALVYDQLQHDVLPAKDRHGNAFQPVDSKQWTTPPEACQKGLSTDWM